MQIILLDRVSKLGALGEQVKVKPGYARNYLIPKGKALPATAANIKQFEVKRAELEKAAIVRLADAKQRAEALEGATVTLRVQAGEEGRLFGSVTAHDICRAFAEKGHTVAKNEVWLPTGPIRQVGEYEIELYLEGAEGATKVVVSVKAEQSL